MGLTDAGDRSRVRTQYRQQWGPGAQSSLGPPHLTCLAGSGGFELCVSFVQQWTHPLMVTIEGPNVWVNPTLDVQPLLRQPHRLYWFSHSISLMLMPPAFKRKLPAPQAPSSKSTPSTPHPLCASPGQGGRRVGSVEHVAFGVYCVCVLCFALSSDSL